LNIAKKEGVGSAKREILIEIEVPSKERIQMGSDALWNNSRMR
jgi:hypothetical protein